MQRPLKIVFLDAQTLGSDISLAPVASLGEFVSYPSTKPEEVFDRIAGFDVVITNKVWMGKEQIDSNPALKLICVAATGTNNVDTAYAATKGIPVRNAVDYSTESVTQVTWMHILNLVGQARWFDGYVKDGSYSASGCFTNANVPFFELKGKTFGTVGLGNIGSRVAGVAEAFGMKVLYYPTSGKPHSDRYEADTDLHHFLSRCDVVSVHCPLNDRTNGLIGYDALAQMKRSAVIVNMGRGGIIVEEDLARGPQGHARQDCRRHHRGGRPRPRTGRGSHRRRGSRRVHEGTPARQPSLPPSATPRADAAHAARRLGQPRSSRMPGPQDRGQYPPYI